MSKDKDRHSIDESIISAWLGDASGERIPDMALDLLDQAYLSGPDEVQVQQALDLLRANLMEDVEGIVFYSYLDDALVGKLYIGMSDRGIVSLQFVDSEDRFRAGLEQEVEGPVVYAPAKLETATEQLRAYLQGKRGSFQLPVDLSSMTTFQQRVLNEVAKVPRGMVVTYGELAKRIGKPKAARAVGQALGSNPVPIIVPCHRIIASDGTLGGYSGRRGIKTKEQLLRLEGAWIG